MYKDIFFDLKCLITLNFCTFCFRATIVIIKKKILYKVFVKNCLKRYTILDNYNFIVLRFYRYYTQAENNYVID